MMDIWVISKFFVLAYILFFSVYLLFKDNTNKINYFLIAFLSVEALSILNTLLLHFFAYTHAHFPYLFYIDNSLFYLRGALLFLYIKSYTNENFKLRYAHLLHLVPFVLLLSLYVFYFHRFDNMTKTRLLETGVLPSFVAFIIDLVMHLAIVAYLIASLRDVYRYKMKLKNTFSNILMIWQNWIYFLVAGFCVIMLLDISFIIVFHSFGIYPNIIVSVINVMVFLLIVLIMFKGLNKPEIFVTMAESKPVKYAGSSLKEADRLAIRNKLEQLMILEKKYNDPDVSIKDLADEMGVLPKHLSQVINEDFQQNFFDYINRFRIEEAKDLLINYPSSAINVLEILYKTGFNSKTSFNLAFKKYTGHTPTSYRRLHSKVKDRVKSVHF